jgi:ADP-ribose pyrophosphatase YjhB (NUDIX family)
MTAPAAHPVVAVAAVVFDAAGRVLLIERGRPPGVGQWTVPGGKLHPRRGAGRGGRPRGP